MDAFDMIDEIALAERPAQREAKVSSQPTINTSHAPIATPAKAKRSRANSSALPIPCPPGSTIAAGETPSPTRANETEQSSSRVPASKLSPQGAEQASSFVQPIRKLPVPKVPARAGRQSDIQAHPTHAPTDALIPVSAGADEASDCTESTENSPRQRNPARKSGDAGQVNPDTPFMVAGVESSSQEDGGGHGDDDDLTCDAPANTDPARVDDAGQSAFEYHSACASIVEQITALWRMRQRWHRAEKSLILQGKALCRSWTNGDKDAASKLFDLAAEGKETPPEITIALMPFLASIKGFRPERVKIEKELQRLAKSLPIWAWVSEQKGFGPLNLAAIVGESGEIGSYRNPSCLWKRMGLAVIGNERQRKKSDAEGALAHGYNPARRAVAYLLGDCLIKGNGEGKYRTLYLARKEIEAAKEDVKTKAHAHNRAARYMTKRVLRDLWSAWRT